MQLRTEIVLAWIAWILCSGVPSRVEAASHRYVDPLRGSDAGEGTREHPWQSLRASVGKLRAGDVLTLRGGTYFESGIRIHVAGREDAPITIRAQPGEVAVVDGGYREFRRPGNQDWEVVDPAKGLYRSRRSYPDADRVHAYLHYAGRPYHLVPYEELADLASTDELAGSKELYVGQGVHWNAADARIYVRLVPGDLQSFFGYEGPPRLDPRDAELVVFPDRSVVVFGSEAAWIVWDGIGVKYQNHALEFRSGSHHVTVRNAELLGGRTHVMIRDGAHHLLFDGVSILDSIPRWIAWQDVKSGSKPAHGLQGAAFNVRDSAHDIEIANSRIEGVFDGIDATSSPHHLHVHHNAFRWIRDDTLQLGSAGHDYHIHHNRMAPVSKGVSGHGSGTAPRPGTTWIHHNVIDTSTPMQYGRRTRDGGWSGKGESSSQGQVRIRPFGRHRGSGFGEGDAWKIYNNTLVFGADANGWGAGHTQPRREGAVHEVYNNVFVQIEDDWIARDATSEGGRQIYDGNLYYRKVARPSRPLFRGYTGKGGGDFGRLAEFLGSPFRQATRAFFEPGWEGHSLEADPRLDAEYRPSAEGPAASGAVPLPAGFPGANGAAYRGALEPAGGKTPGKADRPEAKP